MTERKEIGKIGNYGIVAIVGEDGRLSVTVHAKDGSKLYVDGISTGKVLDTSLFSTENVESFHLNKRNF